MPLDVSRNLARPDIEITDRVETAFGIIRLSGEEDIFAIDGQHRVEGIKLALKEENTVELRDEEQTVIFLSHKATDAGRERTRRLFTTLNKYAKPVSKAEIIALSEDDTFAIVTRRLVDFYPGLSNEFVSFFSSLKADDKKSVTTLMTLYDVVKTLSVPSRRSSKQLVIGPTDQKDVENFVQIAERFWDTLKENVPAIAEVYASDPDQELAAKYRNSEGGNLLFRPMGLSTFAKTTRLLMDRDLSVEEAVKSLSKVALNLAEDPWRYVAWNPTKKTVIQKYTRLVRNLLLVESGHKPESGFDVEDAYLQTIGDANTKYRPPQV